MHSFVVSKRVFIVEISAIPYHRKSAKNCFSSAEKTKNQCEQTNFNDANNDNEQNGFDKEAEATDPLLFPTSESLGKLSRLRKQKSFEFDENIPLLVPIQHSTTFP